MTIQLNYRQRLAAWLMGLSHEQFAAVTVKPIVDGAAGDSEGFFRIGERSIYDQPAGEAQQLYLDVLDAWRKNPMVKRIVAVVTDYVLGDGIKISSPLEPLNKFISRFMNHRLNREFLIEKERLVDELTRAGDLFILLWRNTADGMSYIRVIPKEQIQRIEHAPDDPDKQIAYWSRPVGLGDQPRRWIGVHHPEAAESDHVMLHYSINRPVGAQFGTSDLSTIIEWIKTYAQTLHGRARLHWAMRLFYWIVKVPGNLVDKKRKQYSTPPAAGSIIVADETEQWEAVTPQLHGADASHDLEALRHNIYAGTGFPAIWLGESGTGNLAEAREARGPAERHLKRRQNYVIWMFQDIIFHAYRRAVEIQKEAVLATDDYAQLFSVNVTEISRENNTALAEAGEKLTASMKDLRESVQGLSPKMAKWFIGLWFKFIGEPQGEETVDALVEDFFSKAAVEEEEAVDA